MSKSSLQPNTQCNVYLIELELLMPQNTEKERAYTFKNKRYFYGIVTQEKLDMVRDLVECILISKDI